VNMPTAVLPSVRTTSLTTSALILPERISWAAMATVSFIRTVATRAAFFRRISPTCIATSMAGSTSHAGIHNANCQAMPRPNLQEVNILSVSNVDYFWCGEPALLPMAWDACRRFRGLVCQLTQKKTRPPGGVDALWESCVPSGVARLRGDDLFAPGLQHEKRQQRGQDVGAGGDPEHLVPAAAGLLHV